jgi:GT2 family glycosyltransferase
MKIFAIIPVFNRLELTKKCVESLLNQKDVANLEILIIDDGSTDGTYEYFKELDYQVKLHQGDGSLWWGGSINFGISKIKNILSPNDYVLFVNNDTILDPNCVRELINSSIENNNAIVGGAVYDVDQKEFLLDLAPKADIEYFQVYDLKYKLNLTNEKINKQYVADFLSGRGVLYPGFVILQNSPLKSFLLPHYYSDYEFSYRCSKRSQIQLLICSTAKVFSTARFSVERKFQSRKEKYFSTRSIHNLYRRWIFYTLVGTLSQRVRAPFRLIYSDLIFFKQKVIDKLKNNFFFYKKKKKISVNKVEKKLLFESNNSIEINDSILEGRLLAPVVVFVFNRFLHTTRTISFLKENELAIESDLIVFSDGPRNNADIKEIKKIREYINSVTGFKSIKLISRDVNIGLARNIIEGVSSIVEQYGNVIVLEDDMEVAPNFLTFMNKALIQYEKEKKIWHIGAWNEDVFGEYETCADAVCWRFMNCWGWATWEDRWSHFVKNPKELIDSFSDEDIYRFNLNGANNFWDQVVNNMNGKINTWAIFWYATIFKNSGLCLNAFHSLVKNIGLDGSGVHCGNMDYEQKLILNDRKFFPKYLTEDVNALSILIRNFQGQK